MHLKIVAAVSQTVGDRDPPGCSGRAGAPAHFSGIRQSLIDSHGPAEHYRCVTQSGETSEKTVVSPPEGLPRNPSTPTPTPVLLPRMPPGVVISITPR